MPIHDGLEFWGISIMVVSMVYKHMKQGHSKYYLASGLRRRNPTCCLLLVACIDDEITEIDKIGYGEVDLAWLGFGVS
jgi:hypothetical protein